MEVNYAREKISFGTLRTSSVQDRKDREGMWKKMQEYDRANFLMGASIHTDRHERDAGMIICIVFVNSLKLRLSLDVSFKGIPQHLSSWYCFAYCVCFTYV